MHSANLPQKSNNFFSKDKKSKQNRKNSRNQHIAPKGRKQEKEQDIVSRKGISNEIREEHAEGLKEGKNK